MIREDAVRQFSVYADVIYLPSALYTNVANLAEMATYALDEVGRGRFNGVARVFSPLVANADDVENAVDWYFSLRHEVPRSRKPSVGPNLLQLLQVFTELVV